MVCMMLFVSLSNLSNLKKIPIEADGIELRLDHFEYLDFDLIKKEMLASTFPCMFTLRKSSHGGLFNGLEKERQDLIEQLLTLEPAFFDIEYDTDPEFLKKIFEKYSKTRFILSYHNFDQTPSNLDEIFQSMSKHAAYSYKIATLCLSTNDALRMLLFGQTYPNLSVIPMGEKGGFARILAPVFGNLLNYACLNLKEQTAPGQLTVDELVQVYDYPKLNTHILLYGLIGDPVKKSIGHRYHNQIFREKKLNCLYVKMQITLDELHDFMSLMLKSGFKGLSVTMPLKEKLMHFLDVVDADAQHIGAVNTLMIQENHILGLNVDGIGALNAIEKKLSVLGKKIVILGAGGTAKAVAFEASKRGADVLILNRTHEKAEKLAIQMGCQSGNLSDLPPEYDILINCTSDSLPINPEKIIRTAVVMDVNYIPRETTLLQEALKRGCQVIYGDEMFYNQAALQSAMWTCNN